LEQALQAYAKLNMRWEDRDKGLRDSTVTMSAKAPVSLTGLNNFGQLYRDAFAAIDEQRNKLLQQV
jgi:hypothetical protein